MKEILHLLNPHWRGAELKLGVTRLDYLQALLSNLERQEVSILVGSRRVGKTTLMFQAIHHLIAHKGITPNQILYVSLDHLALADFTIPKIIEGFRAEFRHPRDRPLYLFFDEIQNVSEWSQHLKNLVDFEKVRICVAGSSSLLLKQQESYLTGRTLRMMIFPLSYREFLTFKNVMPGPTELYRHDGLLIDYLYQGGYPEQILSPHPTYLVDLLDNVINKDIVRVYSIKSPEVLNKLLLLLAQRLGQRTSHSKLKNILRVSHDMVRDYIGHLKDAYLIYEVPKFSYSVNEQVYAEKKYYFADTGLRTALLGQRDLGGLAENALFLYLQKRFGQVFYGRANSYEADFVVLEHGQPRIYESKFSEQINDDELKPLLKFLNKFKPEAHAAEATVATRSIRESRVSAEKPIQFIPLWMLFMQGNY